MMNIKYPTGQELVKTGYDDWVALLKRTGHTYMLDDPYGIWLEAFHAGTMLERHGCIHAIQTGVQLYADEVEPMTMTGEDIKQLQLNLLKQVIGIIESKGLRV